MENEALRILVREVLGQISQQSAGCEGMEIPIEVSARHVHLTQEAVEKLFGTGAVLGVKKELSQPGEYLSDKRVKLITPKGEMANVAVLGPVRKQIQVELSATDARGLGLTPPVNLSGNLSEASDVTIMGDVNIIHAPGSVIIAKAHVHLTEASAAAYGVTDGESVRVRIASARPITLDDVIVRVKKTFATAVHIDTDEANACGGLAGAKAYLIRKKDTCVIPQETKVPCEKKAGPVIPAGQPVMPGNASFLRGNGCPAKPDGVTWAEGKLVNEETAQNLCKVNLNGVVRFRKGTIVTAAAKDVFEASRIEIEFV